MDLTILVPTRDRFYYLNKLLNYYMEIHFKGIIYILDSSDKTVSEKNKRKIEQSKKLNILYDHSLGWPCVLMKKFFHKINTNYVVFSGDDDYFTLSGLKACMNFLKKNPYYIGCNGSGISIHSCFSRNKIDFIKNYNQGEVNESSAKERLVKQFANYKVPIFSIFRKNYFQKFLDPVPSLEECSSICPDKAIADEYIIETAMVAYGNIYHLKKPYLVRHINLDRNIGGHVPDYKRDWIKEKNYNKSLNYFLGKISKIILLIDNTNIKQNINLMKKIFNNHVEKIIELESKKELKFQMFKFLRKYNFIRKLRYWCLKHFFSEKKYYQVILNQEYQTIIRSIQNEKN